MLEITKKIQKNLEKMIKTDRLFLSSKENVWKEYLKSFTNDPIFRDPDSSSNNCKTCHSFIKRYGNIVAITEELKIITLFDGIKTDDFDGKNLSKLLRTNSIKNVFFETYDSLNELPYEKNVKKTQEEYQLGIAVNYKEYTVREANAYSNKVTPNYTYTFNHVFVKVPKKFVDTTGSSIEKIQATYRDKKEVFKRGMQEISLDTLELVRDLINQDSLLNGKSYLGLLTELIKEKKSFIDNDNWYWLKTYDMSEALAKFRNTLLGTLCVDLSQGVELNKACLDWNKRADPVNFKKAKAPISKRQIAEAQKFVEEQGYTESFERRVAVLDDINVTEIKHINSGDGKIAKASIFDKVKPSVPKRHKKSEFKDVEEIHIDKFMADILPNCSDVELFLENRLENNLVTLTTSKDPESKKLFTWDNNYAWTYNGNLAGKSMIKQNVSKVGGNIEALLRVSLQWNDEDTPGSVDFDLHSRGINHIYYANKNRVHSCGGHLDVDMIQPDKIGIENITWKKKIQNGTYLIGVKNYGDLPNTGFKVEIEFGDTIFNYYKKGDTRGFTNVAEITVKNSEITVKHLLPEITNSKSLYGLDSSEFHKVNLMCLSPNFWGNNNVGNLHYFFMLDKCSIPTSIKSFHNEFLNNELREHRKVMEILSNTTMVEGKKGELSGVGFNATVRDEVLLRLKGSFSRMIRVKF